MLSDVGGVASVLDVQSLFFFIKENRICAMSRQPAEPNSTVCNFQSMKSPWNWIAFSQNSFVISAGLLYHLTRCDSERFVNETFTSNPIVSSKQ